MITGNVSFVYPLTAGIFGLRPTPIRDCNDSVGGFYGTTYRDNDPWKENCKMFRD